MNKGFSMGIAGAVVAVVAFGAGAYYTAQGGWVPESFQTSRIGNVDSVAGTVQKIAGTTLTLEVAPGVMQDFQLTPDTQVLTLYPAVHQNIGSVRQGAEATVQVRENRVVVVQLFATSTPR